MFIPWVRKIPLEKKMATHSSYSCLGNPMDRGAWQVIIHGVTKESDMTWQLNSDDNQNFRYEINTWVSCLSSLSLHVLSYKMRLTTPISQDSSNTYIRTCGERSQTKDCILYNFLRTVTFLKRQNLSCRSDGWLPETGSVDRKFIERRQAGVGRDIFVVCLSCHGGCRTVHVCQNSSWSFTLCKLQLNKPDFFF